MLKLNQEKQSLTLKLVSTSENELVAKEEGKTTLISEDKIIYFFMKENKCLRFLKKSIIDFVKSNKYNINIDIISFANYYMSEKEIAFRVIVEAILFAKHKSISRKTGSKEDSKETVYNLVNVEESLNSIYDESNIKMEFVNFARDLQDLPPNEGISTVLADKVSEKAKTIDGVKCTVYTKTEIEKMGMGLLLAVNAASEIEPRVVVLEYCGDSSKQKTALVGKGITFDSGGYNLKPATALLNMKFDMSGAAIMLSTVMALAKAKAKANVMAIGMFTDNRIGGHGTLTESIIKSYNGKTIQIDNTDAEGRLVLADGITYAVRDWKADRIIEASTLTGAIVIALGKWHTGVFTKYDELWTELEKASSIQPELVWRMPILPEHLSVMKSTPIADMSNLGSREGGSSSAAAFLNEFAENKPFMHLDIAGTADTNGRGNAVMLRTLFEMLKK